MFVMRRIKDEGREFAIDKRGRRRIGDKATKEDEEMEENETDEEWEEQSMVEDNEPLEYRSDDEVLEGGSGEPSSDVEMQDRDSTIPEESDKEQIREFWVKTILNDPENRKRLMADCPSFPAWFRGAPPYIPLHDVKCFTDDVVDDMIPLFYPNRDDASEHGSDASYEPNPNNEADEYKRSNDKLHHWLMGKLGYHHKDCYDVEHIAGPGCENKAGYSGHEITVDEMRGCHTVQCLVRKPKGWIFEPLPDDEDFEKSSDFFLSGLSDCMPSRDSSWLCVRPARHGCGDPHADNIIWQEDEAEDYAMPFHPPCFEVFKRASQLLRGNVDVVGLTSWYSLESAYDKFYAFPRDPNVKACHGQEWEHSKETAYLVANPLYIPKMEGIFEAAIETDPAFSPRNGAFSVPNGMIKDNAYDPFICLPQELQVGILDNLCSKDIASLRLSSRFFCQLPVSYFQKLLLREKPWLWEAWPTFKNRSVMRYPLWATVTAAEANATLQRFATQRTIVQEYVDIVKEEMPELGSQLDEAFPAHIQAIIDAQELESQSNKDLTPFFLPPDKTNYFTLYTLVTRYWQELRGLQNRKRIWKDCEEILRRVDVLRKEGRIGEHGIVENLRDVVMEHNERKRAERNRAR